MAVDAHIIALFGPVPDGIDLNENSGQHNDVANVTLTAVALLFVLLRFGARFVQKAGFKADDYFIIAALLFSIATCAIAEEIVRTGAGRHVWALTTEEVVSMTRLMFILAYIYSAAVWSLKASIVFLYCRLFPLNDTLFRIGIYTSAIVGTSICIASMITFLVACQPMPYFWDRFGEVAEDGQCINIGTMFIGLASVNVSLDFFLLSIPVPRVLRLQMTARKKIIVITSLLLGICVCVAGLMRIHYLILFNGAVDYSYRLAPVCMWLSMEPAIGIVTTCLPNMLPLYYWCCERLGYMRNSNIETRGHHISSGNTRSKKSHIGGGGGGGGAGAHYPFDGGVSQRLPTYIENNMMLRPKEDDEICLTTMATAARNASNESVEVLGNGILVRSEVTQTIESGDSSLRQVASL